MRSVLFPTIPLKTFQITDLQKLKSIYKQIEKQEEDEEDKNQGRAILCRQCKNKITSSSNRIEKNGSHKHIFNNPGGYIFEIGCFGAAPGCVNQGPPTLEFSWFAGFNWRFSLCSSCHIHLGWVYQSVGGQSLGSSSFFGLILDKLVEDQVKKD
ncbi:CULT domain-containing protein [Desulfonema limicola]|uniref:CULT domain-containing protein n=1 Tax=Desulfonema limicola TaxID=45656 RepID=A0A975B6K3_9BACT|nr:cereblon family protein [Desulfonema limicola]QTA79743.1 CULT domain-containing protein [Desulfonema limicola]